MSDTLTAAPSAAPDASANPIADAGNALKADGASWDSLNFPAMGVTDGDDDAALPDDTTGTKPDANSDADADTPEFVQNAQGQWHRTDGTFANADEIAQIEAQVAADAAAAPVVEEPKGETVAIRRRDGTTREVVIDDPELAQEIRQNVNDGMRKKEFVEKSAVIEAKLAEFQQLDAMLQKNPELVIQNALSPDQKIRLATMLLAEHFDDLVPIIQGYDANPSERIKATADAQRRIRDQESEFQSFSAAQRQASAVRGAVETLIPDTIAPDVAEQFWADASSDLQRAIARGEKVDPATVPQLLAARMKLYGFTAPAGSAPAEPSKPRITLAPSAPSPSPVAVPANDAAKALDATKDQQKRIKLTQRNRANAAAVPPVGAGAAPVRLPPVPKGATIEEAAAASKKLRGWHS